MAFFAVKSPVSVEERVQRRRLLLSDALALFTLFMVTVLLAVLTNYLYQSYASHQAALAQRWLARGEQDLRDGKPRSAIDALRSALAYAPDQRTIEIDLAEAFASAGEVQEATSYFNTLSESEPGDGMINLQLARLAARQGNENLALDYYERAISGTWEGDGYVRRRDVRMEMIGYLLSRSHYDRARNELLVASGNAPVSDTEIQLKIARMMEQAQDPSDAYHLYRTILQHRPSSLEALEGAGRTAFQLGRYLEARQYLERTMSGPAAAREQPASRQQSLDMLRDSVQILDLYPSFDLSERARAERILKDRQVAQARLAACGGSSASAAESAETAAAPTSSAAGASTATAGTSATAGTTATTASTGISAATGTTATTATTGTAAATGTTAAAPANDARGRAVAKTLRDLASHFERHPGGSTATKSAAPVVQPTVDPLQALAARWEQQPKKLTLAQLDDSPDLAQTEVQLIYDTEKITAQVCGAPVGDDALLLKIAEAPDAVEQR